MRTRLHRLHWLGRTVAGAALGLAAGCHEPTGPADTDAQQVQLSLHRRQWEAHGVQSYQYDYRLTGFFIRYAGDRIRLVVRDGVVESATSLATGEPLPGPATQWPTIDALFEEAVQAAAAGALRGVRFDPELGYPTEIDLDGPPDASGSVFATGLQPIP